MHDEVLNMENGVEIMGLSEIISLSRPKAQSVEDFRRLKTNIELSTIDKEIKTIMITSANSGEGRTATASNLAVQMAQGGKKTILIDCDVRNPQIHNLFNLSNEQGLLNFLTGEKKIADIIQTTTEQENLYVLTSGTVPFNSAKLIDSPRLKDLFKLIAESFEYVVIDTAPLIKVADAQIISQYTDGCILVIGVGQIDRGSIISSKELLETVNANILGVVLNEIK